MHTEKIIAIFCPNNIIGSVVVAKLTSLLEKSSKIYLLVKKKENTTKGSPISELQSRFSSLYKSLNGIKKQES